MFCYRCYTFQFVMMNVELNQSKIWFVILDMFIWSSLKVCGFDIHLYFFVLYWYFSCFFQTILWSSGYLQLAFNCHWIYQKLHTLINVDLSSSSVSSIMIENECSAILSSIPCSTRYWTSYNFRGYSIFWLLEIWWTKET